MVLKYGWESFTEFYRDIHYTPSGKQSDAINEALMIHFDIQFRELEEQYIEFLSLFPSEEHVTADVRLTVKFFDTVRRYQQLLDPSAYYLSAWLIWGDQLRERDVVADLVRHPAERVNLLVETMLTSAERLANNGDYVKAEQHLAAINTVLDGVELGTETTISTHPLTADYDAVINTLVDAGYEPQQISLFEDSGKAQAILISNELIYLEVLRMTDGWVIESNQ
jgi:hypothetical protein